MSFSNSESDENLDDDDDAATTATGAPCRRCRRNVGTATGYALYPVRKNGDCTRSRQPSWLDCDESSCQSTLPAELTPSAVMFMSK